MSCSGLRLPQEPQASPCRPSTAATLTTVGYAATIRDCMMYNSWNCPFFTPCIASTSCWSSPTNSEAIPGCRATVEGLTNVQSSFTTHQWQATSMDDNNLHVPCQQSSVIRYTAIPYSTFYSVLSPCIACECAYLHYSAFT